MSEPKQKDPGQAWDVIIDGTTAALRIQCGTVFDAVSMAKFMAAFAAMATGREGNYRRDEATP